MIYYNSERKYLQYGQQLEKLGAWEEKNGFFFLQKGIEENSSFKKSET
jgi:hypothetical protein